MTLRFFVLAFVALLFSPLAANAVTVRVVDGPAGVETWLAEEQALPMIAVNIALPAGSAYDPSEKPGLATMTASLLDEGAGDLPAEAFKEALESKAIRLSASADRDFIVVTLTTLKEHAAEAFRLTGLALGKPRFDAEAVERMRAQHLASLKQDEEDAGTVAARTWYSAYFGSHPYARATAGTPEGMAAITIADIRKFAADHFVRGRIKVAVAGAITEAELKGYLVELFGALPEKAVPIVDKPEAPGKPGTQTIARDERAPVAFFGLPGPMRDDPDYIPAFVANHILGGGGFSARLMDEVRDKRGLTYGIYTAISDLRAASVIIGQVQSERSKILTALEVTKAELARFAREGATARELADAKTYLTGSFALALDSNAKIARALNGFQRAGLGPDYVEKRNALIEAVTLEDVNAMARKYYDPEKLLVVIAGTPAEEAPAPAPAQ